MIVTQNNRDISRSGNIQDNNFSVKATGKAFKILSSSLYKNKIQAVVRELSTNAADAHAFAGISGKPFEVHLPNGLEPYFSVRDFGQGLSEDEVYSVYTTYFESSKTDSNDFTGALGLGSKSPFSYTDSYTVISRHQRFKSAYTLYMNEQDCPVVSRLGKHVPCAADEPDGLEVKMSVRTADMSSFVNEAKRIYSRFTVLPTVKGHAHFETIKHKIEYDGGFYRIMEASEYASGRNYGETGHTLIMGNIAYPVNLDNFVNRSAKGSLLFTHASTLRSVPVEIIAPIGSVDFTAGREDLSYDQKVTVPYLLEVYERLLSDFIEAMSQRFKNIKSEFEARLLYSNSYYDPVFKLIKSNVVWDGRIINTSSMRLSNLPDNLEVRRCANLISSFITPKLDNSGKPVPDGRSTSIEVTKDLIFYVNDLKRNGVKILRSYFYNSRGADNNKYNSYYVVGEGKTATATVDAFLANFPGVKVVLLSTLPLPAAQQAPTRRPTRVKQLVGRGKSQGITKGLPEVEVDLDDGGIYVLSEFSSLKTDRTRLKNYTNLQTYVGSMFDLIGENNPVYVVPVSISSRIEKHPAWIRLEDLARQQIERKMKEHDLSSLKVAQATNTEKSKYNGFLEFYKVHRAHLDVNNNLVCAFAQMFDKIVELKQQAKLILPLANAFDLIQQPKNTSIKGHDLQLENSFNLILQKYPMLSLVDDYNLKDHLVLDYMQQCDKL